MSKSNLCFSIITKAQPIPAFIRYTTKMSSSKTVVRISIDGSSLSNGSPPSFGGYGAVIELNGAVGEFRSTLCSKCDANIQTNNRAELRAAACAMAFLHELAKWGRHKDCGILGRGPRGRQRRLQNYNYLNDSRYVEGLDITATVRTDSTFVLNGMRGLNRVNAHRDLWEATHSCKGCMTRAGMQIGFEYVRGHNGDWANERADELAREIAHRGLVEEGRFMQEGWCGTCDEEFELLADLPHFKEVHIGRDLEEEMMAQALAKGERNGRFKCPWCDRVLASRFAFIQHTEDKHEYD